MAELTLQPAPATFAAKHQIDERAGIIYGISIITAGDVKGHGVKADAKTLETCLAATQSHKDGVLCKGDHGSGVFEALGTIKNSRIDGDKVRGDLHLFKSHPHFKTIMEVAQRMPQSMGMSISFSYVPEVIGEEVFVRVKSLFSIDLVDSPAANPNGMFSSKSSRDTTKLMAAYLAAFGQEQYSAIARQHGVNAFDAMERGIYYSNLSIPGYDFSSAKRHGEPVPLFGTRRGEASARQEKINNCLSRLQ